MVDEASSEIERLRLERDLYLGLLDLNDRQDAPVFLEEALRLIVRVLDAGQAYLEVTDPHEGPSWWRAAGCSDEQVEWIRAIVSRGIIAETLAAGEVVACPSALLDPRFRDRPSVQASQIEAVLCVPIVQTIPMGVLYIQGRRGGGAFRDAETERAKTFARHLAPLVEGLFLRSRGPQTDHVAPFRARLRLDGILGKSAALGAVLREVELVAPLDVAVLITGETGSGKSQLARVIHENSRRRDRRFVEINCSALPDNLIESELFGSVAGAHSTATKRVEGKVGAAQGGTLFLDEIAELSQNAQSKLLQFLHTKDYYALGSSTSLRADVRIIAATNDDLEEAVEQRRFRDDLFYRLHVLTIRMPSLAERPEDVGPLGVALCERAQRSHGLKPLLLSPKAIRAIEGHSWRGNVRELAHAVEAAAIRAAAEGAAAIESAHIFRPVPSNGAGRATLSFHEATRKFQAGVVLRALKAEDWNVAATARALDVTRAHLYNLIKAYGLSRHDAK
ncbi:MAG: sigma 54-interacting transcriptional regulator [Myxococcota bacterium]|nr:sigma 54-interacting transcriptional regulator [Myxococcota bacterium]